ncbi:sensor histidine kinase [Pseudoduganella ginsengisoli]|uniref:sensor histidine kinase n=1 Tax=Pseudoduganella ginsengisoli TaxID=1462440 RepID=UPI00353179D8
MPAWMAPWRRWSLPHWSLRFRLLSIIIVPLAYMFATFVVYLYASGIADVGDELAERGPLVAKVLADSSEYHLATGRVAELRQGVERVVQADRGIYQVDVLDTARKAVVTVAARRGGSPDVRPYEAPIVRRLVWVHTGQATGQPGFSTETVGYVRVTMSPTAAMRRHMNQFYVALLVAALGLVACAALAWQFARHFNDSLQSTMRALRTADAEKRLLLRRVNTAVEEERKSIALEIHDELNATLIAVRLESQRIAALAHKENAADEISQRAQGITKLALGLYNSGRSLVRRLRPEVLDMLGLQGAVEEMVRHHDSMGQGCRYLFRAEGEFSKLDSAVAISAYRIVQEALSNVAKHARATEVTVALARESKEGGDALRITVTDNGKGFDPALAAGGIGIAGMRERVAAYAGTFDVASMQGAGTSITIRLPLAASADAP